jgi:hypothetical protein
MAVLECSCGMVMSIRPADGRKQCIRCGRPLVQVAQGCRDAGTDHNRSASEVVKLGTGQSGTDNIFGAIGWVPGGMVAPTETV